MSGYHVVATHVGDYWLCSICARSFQPDSYDEDMANRLLPGQYMYVWCDACSRRNLSTHAKQIEAELEGMKNVRDD